MNEEPEIPYLNGVPWGDICLRAIKGASLPTLAHQWGVSVDEIKEHLIAPINPKLPGYRMLRTSTERQLASRQARDDLITYLQRAIRELLESEEPIKEQTRHFAMLIACAAKLFDWDLKLSRVQSYQEADSNSVVNLKLISTSPEELAKLAVLKGLMDQPSADPPQSATRIAESAQE